MVSRLLNAPGYQSNDLRNDVLEQKAKESLGGLKPHQASLQIRLDRVHKHEQ